MAQDDLYLEFLEKLKKEKSPQDLEKYLADLFRFGAEELYMMMLIYLTDEDMQALEKIDDEKIAKEEINKRFKLRTGKTPAEFITEFRDTLARNYLFPELTNAGS